jgi:hypothetical protein
MRECPTTQIESGAFDRGLGGGDFAFAYLVAWVLEGAT